MCKNPAMTADRRRAHRVAVLALDGVVGFDLGTPPQVFGAARDAAGRRLYEVRVCTPGRRRRCVSAPGFTVHARARPGGAGLGRHRRRARRRRVGVTDGTRSRRRPWPRCAQRTPARRAARCPSAPARSCSPPPGCSTAARRPRTGLCADRFRALYPQVRLDPDVLFVDDGDVLTSAGVAAGIDLCLHVVRSDHGSEVANRAARRCVVPPWRDGGQSQYIERHVPAAGRGVDGGGARTGRSSTSTSRSTWRRWPRRPG